MDAKTMALRLAIVWGCLFSLNSLGTCMMVGLSNTVWNTITLQMKFVMCVGIFVNWSGTMMAYISKAMHNLEVGRLPPTNGDTSFLTKTDPPPTTPTPMKVAIGLIIAGWICLIMGCANFSNNLFRSEQVLTQTALTAYEGYTNGLASGVIKVSVDESNQIKSARIKVAASLLTVETWRQAYETNSAVKPQAQAAVDALTGDTSNMVYLINLVRSK